VLESTLSSKGLPRQYTAALALALAYLFFARLVDNTYVLLVMTLIPIWATLGVSWNIFSGYSGLISFAAGSGRGRAVGSADRVAHLSPARRLLQPGDAGLSVGDAVRL
jgi:branched-chain amino acid transport system permease protein